jgi:hypothetical protein
MKKYDYSGKMGAGSLRGKISKKARLWSLSLCCIIGLSLLFLWDASRIQAQEGTPSTPLTALTPEQIQKAREMLQEGASLEAVKEKLVPSQKRGERPPSLEKPEKITAIPERPEEKPGIPERAKPPEEKSEIEEILSGRIPTIVSKDLTQFGYNIFRATVSTFAPVTDVPVGPDYVIGPGDRFDVTLWGRVEGSYAAEVDRNGEITLPKIGTLKVWGLTFSELKECLLREFSKHYKGFYMNVAMGELRTIRVYVVAYKKRKNSPIHRPLRLSPEGRQKPGRTASVGRYDLRPHHRACGRDCRKRDEARYL